MRKKLIALLLVATMITGGLTGCGSGTGNSSGTAGGPEGKILNIWCWNDEFQSRFNDYYPEVKEVASDKSTTTLKDGTIVKWTQNPNDNGVYQQKLDEALRAQASASDDDKIDIFLIEADYAMKYTSAEADVATPLSELGITEEDLSDQYQYTKDAVKDEKGQIRAVSWQAAPGLFAYRRSIAKQVLGTDDPDKVQEVLADWDKFNSIAEKMKNKGYYMLSGFDDSFRVFSNNISQPWGSGTTITVDANIMKWIKQTKEFTDKGYNNKSHLFNDAWATDQGAASKVFGFFYSTWGINFTLVKNAGEEGFGDWAVCKGPQPYFWGGTWLVGCRGTDNPEHVKDIMKKMTCNKELMKSMTQNKEIQDYTNTVSGMQEIAEDPNFGSEFLGGQNHIALFSDVAPTIDMSKISEYDMGCNEIIQSSFSDYFEGQVDLEKAKDNFEKAIVERYPDIEKIVWPE